MHNISDRYLGKFTLGDVVEYQNALQCSELCNVEERCMGFNFYKNNGKLVRHPPPPLPHAKC